MSDLPYPQCPGLQKTSCVTFLSIYELVSPNLVLVAVSLSIILLFCSILRIILNKFNLQNWYLNNNTGKNFLV